MEHTVCASAVLKMRANVAIMSEKSEFTWSDYYQKIILNTLMIEYANKITLLEDKYHEILVLMFISLKFNLKITKYWMSFANTDISVTS